MYVKRGRQVTSGHSWVAKYTWMASVLQKSKQQFRQDVYSQVTHCPSNLNAVCNACLISLLRAPPTKYRQLPVRRRGSRETADCEQAFTYIDIEMFLCIKISKR
ncbi:hypothetical protein EVAR_35724_1 [Eumeta japonica]|uniref:Uncharacterized protein n=1 Tax=Eumeta variegata TaxID=151549 RepID=A0A4C1VFD5_EUMVA|nr:hypothetical protein EVAR_35724_1 [Eumeta japonica]